MITPADLIHLPYTPDLSEGGSAYACRWLAYSYERMSGSASDRLRSMVGRVAVELAFRRHLSEQAVPFKVLGATSFTRPDQYEIALGGHRSIIKNFLITRRSQISELRRDPSSLLAAPALIPVDQFAAEGHKPDDLYLFAFLLGEVAAAQADLRKAAAAGQPVHLIHPLPEVWAKPRNWVPIEELALKSECETPITVEAGGQDAGHNFITTTLELPPKQRMLVEKDFHSLAYLHVHSRPEARIGIHSPRHGEAYIISPYAWSNLWIYGKEIILTGWLTHEVYRRKARVLNAGAHTFQYHHTGMKNLMVLIRELNPLGRLLEKVRLWEAEKSRINPSS
jgi:hypothetical protein